MAENLALTLALLVAGIGARHTAQRLLRRACRALSRARRAWPGVRAILHAAGNVVAQALARAVPPNQQWPYGDIGRLVGQWDPRPESYHQDHMHATGLPQVLPPMPDPHPFTTCVRRLQAAGYDYQEASRRCVRSKDGTA